jgi:hypothetical protein
MDWTLTHSVIPRAGIRFDRHAPRKRGIQYAVTLVSIEMAGVYWITRLRWVMTANL